MKNTINFKTILRIVGIIALVAVIGFSMVACDDGTGNNDNGDGTGSNSSNTSINGAWREVSGGVASGMLVTIEGSNGFFTQVTGDWLKARDKGNITIGDVFIRNIASTGNRTWSCQNILVNGTTYALANWADGTLTLSTDGNTLTKNTPTSGTPVITYSRITDGINGAWREVSGGVASGMLVTIEGSNGFFTQVTGDWLKARDKGNITIGDVFIRNIASTGNRTWSCQNILVNGTTYALANWADGTLTLSADGNTLTKNTPTSGTPVITYTRVR
ncbi:hypothetical protein R84B8_00992 [Treponema sp. R8-4-B8]